MAPGRRDGPSWPSWGCPWEGDRKGGVPEGGTAVVRLMGASESKNLKEEVSANSVSCCSKTRADDPRGRSYCWH